MHTLSGISLYVGSIFIFMEFLHYLNNHKTIEDSRKNFHHKISNDKTKSQFSIVDLAKKYSDNLKSIQLENRSFVFRIPFILSKFIKIFNYYLTSKLKSQLLMPINNTHSIYMRYSKTNTNTIVIFCGIIAGRIVLNRMIKYIPQNFNIIGVVYEEISTIAYEDIVYSLLSDYNLKDVVVYSWSYGTLFANGFLSKYENMLNIKLKIFCDMFGIPTNTLYIANICGNNFNEAYKLIKLKVRPFWNSLLMFLLFKSEFIEKRIMTLKLNDYLIWSYTHLNSPKTLIFISHDDMMYNVESIKHNCPDAMHIEVYDGGHCSGINRKSLLILKNKLCEF